MQQRTIHIIIVFLTFLSAVCGQLDPSLCPDGPTSTVDSRWQPIPSRFEVITELITGNEMAELSQAFSTQRDSIEFSSRSTMNFYWNFATNEKFLVLPAMIGQQVFQECLRQRIEPTSETSVIQEATIILKPSALLGFDARNQLNSLWGIRYDGDEDLRGIPANRFKSCFYVSDIKATVSATYYASDPNKFRGYLPANTSALLQINVNISTSSGLKDSYIYNVFRYIPNPSYRQERQALETPTGVYCQNRTSTLVFPQNLPSIANENLESFVATMNSSIFSANALYDTENQLSFYKTWYPRISSELQVPRMNQIHDFATGLSYMYNIATGQCVVDDLAISSSDAIIVDGKPNLIQMGSIQHFFMMDTISYQYTGEKQCRDRVWCHVWVGENLWPNKTLEHREWYWASRINDEPLTKWIPMKYISKIYQNYNLSLSFETTIFNFRGQSDSFSDVDYTLANCYREIGSQGNFNLGVIFFVLANDQEYPVQQNIVYLRYKILQTLATALGVRPIRVSHIIIDRDEKDILVTFTLLDTPPRLGSVENPLQEIPLMKAIERLRTVIDADGLVFRAKYDTKEVTLRARVNSLQVVSTSFDQHGNGCVNETVVVRSIISDECPETTVDPNLDQPIETIYKSSGPFITSLYIGFIILGLLFGTLGGFFILKRFSKP